MERRLEMLEETQQIKKVMAKYFKVIDGKDVKAVMSLFNGMLLLFLGKPSLEAWGLFRSFG